MSPTMSAVSSAIDVRSAQFQRNRAAMLESLGHVRELQEAVPHAGGSTYLDRHRQRGKLLTRERVDLLIDRGSALLELSPLAGHMTDDPLGGGVVTAIGVVSGTECMIVANDPTVRGGSQSPTTVRKMLRAYEIARLNRLPLISLVESAGADLERQAELFVPGGATFKEISRLSKRGIPTVAVVFGSSTAGGAYVPGMSDYTVFIENQARVYLGGPPLVKMATGEDADEEELGGAAMHARTSGLADYLARSEREALNIARRIAAQFGPIRQGSTATAESIAPLYDPDELLGIPSADPRQPYDIREVIIRITDNSRLDEFKPLYGANLVCGWSSLHGQPLGIIANNGVLFSEEAQKGAHFIQLCNQTRTPLLFIHNITGFMVGTRYEQGGIIRDGAKLINAVSNSDVPHLALMVGSSYGAGNYAMSGRAYDPRFVFSWPTHRIAVMGGRQLAGVLSLVRRRAAEKADKPFDEVDDAQRRGRIEAQIDEESTALFATGHLWDDGIIDPRDTRIVLGIALSVVAGRPTNGSGGYAVFRM